MSYVIYLNELDNNKERINISSNSIRTVPNLYRFNNLKILNIDNNKIKEICILPDTLIDLTCSKNQLSSLPPLPKYLEYLDCNHNKICKLPELPYQLVTLYCSHNKIIKLPLFNSNLKVVNCKHNKIIELPYLYKVTKMRCEYNKIKFAPYKIYKNLKLTINNNPIYNDILPYYKYHKPIIYGNKDITMLKMLKILYKFRLLYSVGKIKSLIMNYVWIHIRKYKIEEYYKPDNLIKYLNEHNNDLDSLDYW